MPKFKMVAKDINSSPTQHRTWEVNDEPDYQASLYSDYKSGDTPLEDIFAYDISNYSISLNFNLPTPLSWIPTKKVLPRSMPASHLAIIDGYGYLFGGQTTNKILKSTLNNPTDWTDDGYTLPANCYDGQLAIINDRIYIFGGKNSAILDTIFSAPISNPFDWTNHGSLLPKKLYSSQLLLLDNFIYLFGGITDGYTLSTPTSSIFRASTSDPLTWQEVGSLPTAIHNSHIGVMGNYIHLFGGETASGQISSIYRASVSTPLVWSSSINYLPHACSGGQFFIVGNYGYLITPTNPLTRVEGPGAPSVASYSKILRCSITSPTNWIDTKRTVPGNLTKSQVAIIYDRLFMFGGSGNTAIFASNYSTKYDLNHSDTIKYSNSTRVSFPAASEIDKFKTLGFPPWKTDY